MTTRKQYVSAEGHPRKEIEVTVNEDGTVDIAFPPHWGLHRLPPDDVSSLSAVLDWAAGEAMRVNPLSAFSDEELARYCAYCTMNDILEERDREALYSDLLAGLRGFSRYSRKELEEEVLGMNEDAINAARRVREVLEELSP